jgi:hypothetical protein
MNGRGPGFTATIGVDAAGLGASLALVAVFVFAVVSPALQSQAAERAEAAKLAAARADAKKRREDRTRFDTAFERATRDLAATRVKVEPTSKLNTRLAGLTEAGARFGLVIDRIQPETQTATPKATLVPIRVEGRGGFVASRDWLARLREEYPDIAVRGLDIGRDAAAAENAAKFSFELVWYAAPSVQPSQPEPPRQ